MLTPDDCRRLGLAPYRDAPMERDRILAGKPPAFLWCLHCERAYPHGHSRDVEGLEYCPFDGCDGTTVADGWSWSSIARQVGYPRVPVVGRQYPAYPTAEELAAFTGAADPPRVP